MWYKSTLLLQLRGQHTVIWFIWLGHLCGEVWGLWRPKLTIITAQALHTQAIISLVESWRQSGRIDPDEFFRSDRYGEAGNPKHGWEILRDYSSLFSATTFSLRSSSYSIDACRKVDVMKQLIEIHGLEGNTKSQV